MSFTLLWVNFGFLVFVIFNFFFTWGQVGLDESYLLNEMIIRKSAFCVCLGYRCLILKHHHQT